MSLKEAFKDGRNRMAEIKATPRISVGYINLLVLPGYSAEIVAITGKGLLGHNQQAILLVHGPTTTTRHHITNRRQLAHALASLPAYNSACAAITNSNEQ